MTFLSTLRLGQYWVKILFGSRRNHLIKMMKYKRKSFEIIRQRENVMFVSSFFIRSALIVLIFFGLKSNCSPSLLHRWFSRAERGANAKRSARSSAVCAKATAHAPRVMLVSYSTLAVALRARYSAPLSHPFCEFLFDHRFSLIGQAGYTLRQITVRKTETTFYLRGGSSLVLR